MTLEITASAIEAHTKGELKRLRKSGLVPVAVQLKGEPTIHLQSRAHALDEIILRQGASTILDLTVEPGKNRKQVVIHQVQRDPISRQLLQVTLQTIVKGEAIKTH